MRISANLCASLATLCVGIASNAVEIHVLTPDGKPAAGVKVAIVESGHSVMLKGLTVDASDCREATASPQGVLNFDPPAGAYELVVVDRAGFVRTDSSKTPLQLTSWSRIEGELKIGSKPGVNQSVGVWLRDDMPYDPKAPQVYLNAATVTDANGHFKLQHIPAAKLEIGRGCEWHMPGNRSASAYTQRKPIELRAGETAHVQIGGMGRPVIGRLIVPTAVVGRDDWEFGLCNVGFENTPLPLPMPENVKNASLADQQKWYAAFNASDAGKQFAADQWKKLLADHSQFPMDVQRDGAFRIEDLPAGAFKLHAEIVSRGGNGHKAGDTIASVDSNFTAPEIHGGRSDQPLKLPDFGLRAYSLVRVGDLAPEFSIKTLGGQDLKLSQFRGKFVLLDFWATWCGACVAELPNIKEANNHFAKSGKVEFVSLSMDDGPFEPKAYVDQHGFNWTQGFLGNFDSQDVTKDYGIESIPSVWLIGPDGKVIEKNVRGERVKAAIEKALSK